MLRGVPHAAFLVLTISCMSLRTRWAGNLAMAKRRRTSAAGVDVVAELEATCVVENNPPMPQKNRRDSQDYEN